MSRLRYVVHGLIVAVLLVGLAAPALAQSGRMNGLVMDENGEPLTGVQIRAEKPDANPPVRETTTDDDGRFSLIGFASGQ